MTKILVQVLFQWNNLKLSKIPSGKSHDNNDIIVFEKLRTEMQSWHFKILQFTERFRDGLVWTAGLIVEMKIK